MILPYNNNSVKDIILSNYVNKSIFKQWDGSPTNQIKQLELMLSTKCDFKCKYCYYNKFGHILHPDSINPEIVLNNLDSLFKYLDINSQIPQSISLFSGEILTQEIGFKIIYKIIDFLKDKPQNSSNIVIPTGFSFMKNQNSIDKVKDIYQVCKKYNIKFRLSCSMDGKYSDSNRPFKSGYIRDDSWYDSIFKFLKEYGISCHSMVYFENIDSWIDNFNWWFDMHDKHQLHNGFLHMLDVRNSGWTQSNIKSMYKLSRHIAEFILNRYSDLTIHEIINKRWDCNWFSPFINGTYKAIPCGFETSFAIRLSDLKFYPCHRLQYPEFEGGQLLIDQNEIKVKSKNPEMYICSRHTDGSNSPICENCSINKICDRGCYGSQYETMGDPFIPIPEVCAVQFARTKGVLDIIYERNRENEFLQNFTPPTREQIKKVRTT